MSTVSHVGSSTAVLILEDDPIVRDGLIAAVTVDRRFRLAGAGGSVAEGRRLVESLPGGAPALGIFDLRLPDGSALEVIPFAVERGVDVLVITIHEDDQALFDAISAGARGYVLKTDPRLSVVDALCSLAEGGSPISPRIASRLLDRLGPRAAAAIGALTAREREVAELFAKGATYAEVGRALGISVNTVRQYVRHLYEKLHVASKAELVAHMLAPERR